MSAINEVQRLCILFMVLANTSAFWSQPLLSPSSSLRSVVPYTSLCDSVSYSTVRALTWGPGRVNKQSASPLRRDEEKTGWRGGGGGERFSSSILLVDLMRQKGRKDWRRNAVSLTAQCKQNSPRPLLDLKPQAASSEEEMLSVPEFVPLRRCFRTRRGHHKKPLSIPFRFSKFSLEENKTMIHPLHWQYEQVGPVLWCTFCPWTLTWRERGEERRLAD